ncbi:D-alanine--D-alanine ligase [Candidatus Kaiserbacteria bacterium]|nr:D-alanine--D-alanine ligase [Candidatus Kaiserbacteria bacterium]
MQNVRVAVLRGGPSEEYDISMQTGAQVLAVLDTTTRFDPLDVVITKNGEWLVGGYVRLPEQVLPIVDVVFVALHGTYGEDGTLQRLLDRYGSRYTGSGAFASGIAMHKATTKEHLKRVGINTPKHFLATEQALDNLHGTAASIHALLGMPVIVKPVASGSSVGVVKVNTILGLEQALKQLLAVYPGVLIEELVVGTEATCGVIEGFRGEALYALPPVEIVPKNSSGLFDHVAKYDGSTEEICPGRFDTTIKEQLMGIAKQIHQELGLSQYSRSDFIVTPSDIYFLEVNTLPGLSTESLFPKALTAVGSTFSEFVSHLLEDALERRR